MPVSWSIIPFVRPLAIGGLGPWQHQLPCQNSSAYICKARGEIPLFLNLSDHCPAILCMPSRFKLRVSVLSRGCRLTVGDLLLCRIVRGSASPNLERYYSSKIVKHAKGKKRGDCVSVCTYVHIYVYTSTLLGGCLVGESPQISHLYHTYVWNLTRASQIMNCYHWRRIAFLLNLTLTEMHVP